MAARLYTEVFDETSQLQGKGPEGEASYGIIQIEPGRFD
jgi:hypothetical protein